jgi:acetyltransferase
MPAGLRCLLYERPMVEWLDSGEIGMSRLLNKASVVTQSQVLAGLGRTTLRSIRPQDHERLGGLVGRLSSRALRARFHGVCDLSPRCMVTMCTVNPEHSLALVVTAQVAGMEHIVADARFSVAGGHACDAEAHPCKAPHRDHESPAVTAEFALMVDEAWQGQGLGTWAMKALEQAARDAGLTWLQGSVLRDNKPMRALMLRCGYALDINPDDDQLLVAQKCVTQSAQRVAREVADHGLLTSWVRSTWQGLAFHAL